MKARRREGMFFAVKARRREGMISPLLVASTGARTTLLALADTRRSWAPPTPTPRTPDQVVGVAPRSAPLQAAGAFDALLVCAPLVYSINKSLYGFD